MNNSPDMRQVVFDAVVARYTRKHRPLDEVAYDAHTLAEAQFGTRRLGLLREGKISIEHDLIPLTNEQLLDVFQSQCCQDYR
jgi:hypothetical protein